MPRMLLALTLTATTKSALAAALAAFVALLAAAGFRMARGTTLAAPLAWAIASAAALALVEGALAWNGPAVSASTGSLLRYVAAVGTFCPLMAVLGAKRPQDRGWQWIVLSLWIILLVPAGQAWASQARGQFELPLAWKLLVVGLMSLTVLNYCPTQRVAAPLLVVMGQFFLLAPFFAPTHVPPENTLGGIFYLALAAVAARGMRRDATADSGDGVNTATKGDGSRFLTPDDQLAAFTQRWLNFRDAWGAFWALRILHRINETATLSHWPVRLQWNGFVPVEPTINQTPPPLGASPQSAIRNPQSEIPLSPQSAIQNPKSKILPVAHIQQTLDTLLRRFERT
jgi:uncharacterized membrane protein YhaH (DUF805 family)